MRRDLLPQPRKRQLSRTATSKFFFLVDGMAKQNEPTPTQMEALERSYMATGQFVMESPEFKDLVDTVHAHCSRAIGTLVRPLRGRAEGFDVDIALRLQRQALGRYGNHPGLLIDHLHQVLQRYAQAHGLKLKRWERCVTVEYAGSMFVDIAPIIHEPLLTARFGETHARIPDRELRLFDGTNPMGLVRAFDEAAKTRANFTFQEALALDSLEKSANLQKLPDVEVQERLLSRLIQLIKLHRNVAFGNVGLLDLAPSSIFVTTLAAAAYVLRAPIPHDGPLDLLLDVLDMMPLLFQRELLPSGADRWVLANPTAPGTNLAESMNGMGRQEAFTQWHSRLSEDVEALVRCLEGNPGTDVLYHQIETTFGNRAAQAVHELTAPKPMAGGVRTSEHGIVGPRVVSVGMAGAAASLHMPARAHKFFGHE
jgi:hypothetical protein